MSNRYRVTATALNIRSEPKAIVSTRIAVLPNAHIVTKLEESDIHPWWKVQTILDGLNLIGFVSSQYLTSDQNFQPKSAGDIDNLEVHLTENRSDITRSRDGGRAFPLGESNRPFRTSTDSDEKISQLRNIIEWLNVESNKRYIRKPGTTFCNIYAYDYCYLSKVYLPRVWWTESALLKLHNGSNVVPTYGETLRELNANNLFDWLRDFGKCFGWIRTFAIDELQKAANSGSICITCAKREDLNRSGHIVAVVAETETHKASRNSDGSILRPLESQAGSRNFKYVTKNSNWWAASQFSQFGFWIHE